MDLSELIGQTDELRTVRQQLTQPGRHLLTGVLGSAKTLILKSLFQQLKKPFLVVTDTLSHAQELAADLTNVLDEEQVRLFPVEELVATEIATSSPDFQSQRVRALTALSQHKAKVVVTSASGLRRRLAPVKMWNHNQLTFKVGAEVEFEQVSHQLVQMGYQRQKLVDRPGDFAIRGSIIDIYSLNHELPVRIDLFDTEIDSIRFFEIGNQRSLENIDEISVMPATDMIQNPQIFTDGIRRLQELEAQVKPALKEEQADELRRQLDAVITMWKDQELLKEHRIFTQILYPQATSLLDYLDDGVLVLDDYAKILEHADEIEQNEQVWLDEKEELKPVLDQLQLGFKVRKLVREAKMPTLFMSLFKKGIGRLKFASLTDLKVRTVQQFFSQMPLLQTEARRWNKQNQTVVLMIQDEERLTKISQTLDDFEIPNIMTQPENLQRGILQIVRGSLQSGFEVPSAKLVVLTETELFAKATKKRAKRLTMENAERLKSYTDLKEGDFVVHVDHGVGRYLGVKTMEVDGKHQDYLTLEYQKGAKLYVPVNQLDRVQKYVSSDAKTPHLNKLGGSEWHKTKKRVASKIEDIADELVDLYAEREMKTGFAFPKDDAYQREFEDAFPYTETPDQLRSTSEIKQDMENKHPMDRLLIGDVGYGKTEVALRAAFKAVEAGKQVAFLVPTTVLAQQHYETMIERFENFPIEIGILSRFNTPAETKQVLENLKDGKCDIVVGTHRLLSKDVQFKDLGLLIIDEEQRFGVKHKERLKQLKSTVDVLTLTATPIPRTLNMSMLGVRDLSVIETAPVNRYPIQTYVMEQDNQVIANGIRREMERGGQVFYLHNRVKDIEKKAAALQALVPEARITYIHGQMTENQMEKILMDFIHGDYDVLVTTTIIETGVDIPNANTLFVEDADRMGLAQLYQLRGRVGRSSRVAYAYFMYKPDKVLTEVSEKRLEAIKDFTELGSGFKIAMRDLAIRGAGNLLGKQQHGFIDSVGYDLYTQMLNEAVARKRGVKPEEKTDATINLDVEAYIPQSYIDDEQQKIEIYKRIRQFKNFDQYQEVQDDLIDRFGDYPDEVSNLLEIGLLKMDADRALVDQIFQKKDEITIVFSKKATTRLSGSQFLAAVSQTKLSTSMNVDNLQMKITIKKKADQTLAQIILEMQNLLSEIAKMLSSQEKVHEG
ncbi:transcription-repair coupling factor [Ligilactobacillus aviarius]|uniref:Transcription-repair-coupling factor n=1 Tax=Ligilactobacillus aviarius TaxID=1606 RepID=A0A179CST9_9LACO|nr:transcription-repair coupling factor [Ligilactobacillus aviarius]OAP99667.1 transcription-repair coupling factor [Ligilactobacillus aviarius]OAP99684.1 transcription-repair coupling factor [Ligilactobacillus aviarius]OAQ00363.1 transcription-repair coupling factor [Ligilactobacillus aviarius]OAQ02058.1 transcription-repair coupling factor [Ligilactobacillus aviarius]OAQ04001.1 transcription-repair coupling factor [Ligilactobacillus aviarius]